MAGLGRWAVAQQNVANVATAPERPTIVGLTTMCPMGSEFCPCENKLYAMALLFEQEQPCTWVQTHPK